MMQITLTPEQEQFLQAQLKMGKYHNPQEEIAAEIEAYRASQKPGFFKKPGFFTARFS
jgi:Arc/MetJ-type ribon-helix-helix transcriptional regulator